MRTHSQPLPRIRSSRGTTLLEVLVVIVIFLVGILAIIQIFPRGFQILLTTRNNSVASSVARGEVERIKSRTDQLPEMILPVTLTSSGTYIADPSFNPDRLGPMGDSLAEDGTLSSGSTTLGSWQLFSGPNTIRRVIGEGSRVPAPRQVGTGASWFGGLMVVQFGPIAYNATQRNISVYGNDLAANLRPDAAEEIWSEGEFFVVNPNNNQVTLRLPAGAGDRAYRVSFSAYTTTGAKRDYIDLPLVPVPATSPNDLYSVPVDTFMVNAQKWVPDTIASIDLNTLKVQRAFQQVPLADPFSNEPYEYKLLDNRVGVLLFNPIAASVYVSKPNGREPLEARVNYDVYDWRLLREDMRLSPSAGIQQHKLPIGSLKVGSDPGIDGRTTGPIAILEIAPSDSAYTDNSVANEARADNFVVVDLDTGGVLMERLASDPVASANPLISVNKNSGLVTFIDSDGNSANGTTGKILLPDKTVRDVQLENRALRILYRANNEFAVQVLKAASQYSVSPTINVGVAQYYVGGSNGSGVTTRLYFPPMDAGRKVNLGEVNYVDSGGFARQILGSDFVIRYRAGDSLPSIDIQEVDANAASFTYATGSAVKNVRGASVAVRVLWNPERFSLSSDLAQNMSNLEKFGQSWRRSTNETYLQRGEVVR